MRFKDKVALITGGGSGIGRATAIAFGREGAKVAVCGRREEPLKEVVGTIAGSGGEATYFTCDVSQSRQVDKLISDTVAAYGKLDIVFSNAGVSRNQPIDETTDDDANAIFDINIKGGFWVLRESVRQMKKQGTGGIIVNMSSMSGLVGHTNRAAYCASKGAIINMTRAIAIEVAPHNIRVNSVCPGPIETPIVAEAWIKAPQAMQSYIDLTAMKRIADPEEVASVVLFLSCDESSYITGANLPIDGGFVAGK